MTLVTDSRHSYDSATNWEALDNYITLIPCFLPCDGAIYLSRLVRTRKGVHGSVKDVLTSSA